MGKKYKQKKQGLDPVFHSKDIGITEELDYWKQQKIPLSSFSKGFYFVF